MRRGPCRSRVRYTVHTCISIRRACNAVFSFPRLHTPLFQNITRRNICLCPEDLKKIWHIAGKKSLQISLALFGEAHALSRRVLLGREPACLEWSSSVLHDNRFRTGRQHEPHGEQESDITYPQEHAQQAKWISGFPDWTSRDSFMLLDLPASGSSQAL